MFMQNIYNDNRNNTTIDAKVMDFIGKYIDAEIVEEVEKDGFVK